MPYDQVEAKNRFEGLLGLWKNLHERCKQDITTMDQYRALAEEGKHLVDAFNDEVAQYDVLLKKESPYMPTLHLIMEIQGHAMCSGQHLIEARQRIENIQLGKAAFYDMLGKKPTEKVWN